MSVEASFQLLPLKQNSLGRAHLIREERSSGGRCSSSWIMEKAVTEAAAVESEMGNSKEQTATELGRGRRVTGGRAGKAGGT